MIRNAMSSDAQSIVNIYNHYILHSVATFEEDEIDAQTMQNRIEQTQALGLPWLVDEREEMICGYAYADSWNKRSAYRHTVQVSIYLAPHQLGRGIGSALYEVLFTHLRERHIHCAIAAITQPNPASVALHEKFAMHPAGLFQEVGYKFGRWLDVGYWTVCLASSDGPISG